MAARARFELLTFPDPSEADEIVEVADLDLGAFYAENDLPPADVNAIGALAVGEEHLIGGGAAGLFAVRRVA